MCVLYIMGGFGIVLTLLSGQYSAHTILFWAFLGCAAATGFFYSLERMLAADPVGQGKNTMLTIALGTGLFGFATLGLFVWLCIVIWI